MGTQDDKNGAAPQNEFISGFTRGAISGGKDPQQSFGGAPKKIGSGLSSGKAGSSLQSRMGANPFELADQKPQEAAPERPVSDPFETEAALGLVQRLKNRLFNNESGAGDARQKAMVVMIPILFIIMIFMFRQVLWKSPKKTKGANRAGKSVAAIDESSADDIEWEIPDPLPAKMRDPITFGESATPETVTAQQAAGVQETHAMDVKSILYSTDKPSVVIGDKLVYLNQRINGATVVEIHKDYIVFEKDGQKWSQKVAEEPFQAGRVKPEQRLPKDS